MTTHRIPMHPLDGLNHETMLRAIDGSDKLTADERRHWAECDAVKLATTSPIDDCAEVFSSLLSAHLTQLNTQRDDMNNGRYYANPAELIRKEKDRKQHRKITYTGNIAQAHQQLADLKQGIICEETPGQLIRSMFLYLLFGMAFLALAVWSIRTGAVVPLLYKLVTSKVFLTIFVTVTLVLSLFFGFFSIGVLLVGGLLLFALMLDQLPWAASFVFNGVLVVVAVFLLSIASGEVKSLFRLKRMSPEERRQNQAAIDEKNALQKELTEYSELMCSKIEIINKRFYDHTDNFHKETSKHLHGIKEPSEYFALFRFLNRYYYSMRQ